MPMLFYVHNIFYYHTSIMYTSLLFIKRLYCMNNQVDDGYLSFVMFAISEYRAHIHYYISDIMHF